MRRACACACACVRVRACGYQADLGLQLDLQGLQGPLELGDLALGGVQGAYVARHLDVQLVKLVCVQQPKKNENS